MVESSRNNSENVGNFEENCATEDLYDGEEAEGFDNSKGGEWIYPINYPVRAYQKTIVSNALFKNTLVCLPTGLGKTFIAAVVMYNFHRWYPMHKVVFMAHSKPLVAQQVDACCGIVGLSSSVIAELNGSMPQSNRKKQWESKKIFFLTPQVFSNDLARGNVKADSIRCIVIDEAHKALGNQAYCQVIRAVKPFNSKFRVLALSATPGDDMNMVRAVIENLMISHLELRNEEDPDIKPYLHEKKVETVVLKLDQHILDIREMFFNAVNKYIQPLVMHKLLPRSFSSINPFSLILKQRQLIQNSRIRPELRGIMLSNFSVAISLFYALEELTIHGMRAFLTKLKNLQSDESTANKAHSRIANDDDIKKLIDHVSNILAPDQNISLDGNISITRLFDEIDSIETCGNIVYSHPKFIALENIIKKHFDANGESTKVIVFCKSRQCTGEICQFLARFKPLVKPMIFIGQSHTSGNIAVKGFNQSAQMTVMKRFREGVYNTLIATCVAEEGLDIGEVDLIINFDSGKNSNTQVQRSGRTGRKRDGRVVNLVTEGKEHQNYNISVLKGKRINKNLVSNANNLPFYLGNSKLFPRGISPICMEHYFEINQKESNEKKRKSDRMGKKLRDSEVNHSNKRLKENIVDGEESHNLRIKIAREKSSQIHKMDFEKQEKSFSRQEMGFTHAVSHIGEATKNYTEVIEVENTPPMTLYNDDVEVNIDKHWVSDDQLQMEEWNLVNEFLQKGNKMLRPKNNFRNLVNLEKVSKYCKLSVSNKTDLIGKMKVLQNYVLSDEDRNCLNESLDIKILEAYINMTRKKLLTVDGEIVVNLNEKQKSVNVNDELDIVPDDFLDPFEELLPEVISSTPMRNRKESSIPQVKVSPLTDSNFQLLDESDFFNLKENFSPQRDVVVSDLGQSSLHKKKDSSLLSITQALDFISNVVTSKNIVKTGEKKKTEIPDSPSSPILFFSQKPKTGNQFIPNSPILTQGFNRKSSRKRLIFPTEEKSEKNHVSNDNFNDIDNSDLFAETEFALHNHLEKLEENLTEIENKKIALKMGKESRIRGLTVYSSSDENTEEYDLAQVNFDENKKLENLLKTEGKLEMASPITEKSTKKRKILFEENESTVNSCKQRINDETNLGNLDFSSFMKDCIPEKRETHLMESTLVRPTSKMGNFTSIEIENSRNSVINSKENGSKMDLKNEKSSFTCNFSLFGDDDFDDECFNIEKNRKTNQERKGLKEVIEENETSSDSDLFVDKDIKVNTKNNPFPSLEDNANGDIEYAFDDCDLSDGAIEAIKAVEMSEKISKMTLKNFNSDDSEDFFIPVRRKNKHFNETNNESKIKQKKMTKKTNKMGNHPVSEFVEEEVDVSHDGNISSDEENTSGLDEYDSSFVDEREMLTQAQDVDMTAKYLQSTKSPLSTRPGTFKIPKSKIEQSMNIFSQLGSEGESEYENDSFCVSEEESHMEVNEISELELAEVILRDQKKRKRLKEESFPSIKKKKKFKRVLRIESESSDDDVVEIPVNPKTTIVREIARKSPEIQKMFNSSFPIKINLNSSDITENSIRNISIRDTLFIASRQITNVPDIVTCLRAKWNVNVQVKSITEADFIISWRVGINRILLSDFASGSSTSKNILKEMIQKLSIKFQQPVIIVEDDKNKGLPLTTGTRRFMWVKHSMKSLAKVLQSNVKILFSRSKDDTAGIVVSLCKNERKNGHFINVTGDLSPEIEKRMKFYSSLPGVNIANALRIASEFSSISSFIQCCNSAQNIMRELGVSREIATSIYQLLFTAPS